MTKKKFNLKVRQNLIKQAMLEGNGTKVQNLISLLLGLDYCSHDISSKGNGYIGKVCIANKIYHINHVFFDKGTKAVVFRCFENNKTLNPNEFFVDKENFNKYTERDIRSFIKMLRGYLSYGKVYGFDKIKFVETKKLLRQNCITYDSFRGNVKLIDFYIK